MARRRIRHACDRFQLAGAVAAGTSEPEPVTTGFVTYAEDADTGFAVTEQGERIIYDPFPEN